MEQNKKYSALIVCGGKGERAGLGYNKLLFDFGGTTPFETCLSRFIDTKIDFEYVIVCTGEDESVFRKKCEGLGICAKFARGGKTRSDSVKSGLEKVTGEIVAIHDGARPFVPPEVIVRTIGSAEKTGSGIAVVPPTDTVADLGNGFILSATRENRALIQTPQAFRTDLIRKAFSLKKETDVFTDESGLFSRYVGKCAAVPGAFENRKLTYREDFFLSGGISCGTGFDLHKLVENRKLILGGIEIPHTKGLLGHSDADVLTHAIMDALLSSASLRDIGCHFPDTDPAYEGISSILLLEKVLDLLKKHGYKPINVSSVILAQKPKLSPYVETIRANLAKILGLPQEKVGITCTTTEGIGLVGREEGIAVQSYCLVEKIGTSVLPTGTERDKESN